jgi:hypothetical protein
MNCASPGACAVSIGDGIAQLKRAGLFDFGLITEDIFKTTLVAVGVMKDPDISANLRSTQGQLAADFECVRPLLG